MAPQPSFSPPSLSTTTQPPPLPPQHPLPKHNPQLQHSLLHHRHPPLPPLHPHRCPLHNPPRSHPLRPRHLSLPRWPRRHRHPFSSLLLRSPAPVRTPGASPS
ncbi:hypothetical protein LOK49_Contig296G00002 [Camellia lanceoleosa]|nr:hypothetical protein LOK49_Contig296G00002 [Camellia lanceoleosa]